MSKSPTLDTLLELEERIDGQDDQLQAMTISFLVLARCLDASGTLSLDTLAAALLHSPRELCLEGEAFHGVREQLDVLCASVLQLR